MSKCHRFQHCFGALLIFTVMNVAGAAERVQRPMQIHRVAALGLEIWTEADPEWETRIETRLGQVTFHAETPALTYPPAGMTWISVPSLKFSALELREGARGAIHAAAKNYGVRSVENIALKEKRYGVLEGYEAVFSADAHGEMVDVRIFFGHRVGKPAVLIHAFTMQGKLEHISEQIRRSWTHTSYL